MGFLDKWWHWLVVVLIVFVLLGVLGFVFRDWFIQQAFAPTETTNEMGVTTTELSGSPQAVLPTAATSPTENTEPVSVVAENLEIPWEIDWLPNGDMLVTERPGRLLRITSNGERFVVSEISGVRHVGEGGLLGLAVHPDFASNQFIYLYLTSQADGGLINRVERYRLVQGSLREATVILDSIPGAQYHDGGRIEFGPDNLLYVTTGDAQNEDSAQNPETLAGKILRIADDGLIPDDNPFEDSPVFSYGHRNPQGLAWDDEGRLWSTEHGRSGARTGFDELNLIEAGKNYGWPEIEGDQSRSNMVSPALHSGPTTTWAPASAIYLNGSIFFGGLRGEALYEAKLDGTSVPQLFEHFKSEFGRIRDVAVGPDGFVYITTSNADGRGVLKTGDDKIIRIDPSVFE